MMDTHREPASKRKVRVNITMDARLVEDAKALGLNLSTTAEQAIDRVVRAQRMQRFSEDNREAIASWDKRAEENGLWSDGLRVF